MIQATRTKPVATAPNKGQMGISCRAETSLTITNARPVQRGSAASAPKLDGYSVPCFRKGRAKSMRDPRTMLYQTRRLIDSEQKVRLNMPRKSRSLDFLRYKILKKVPITVIVFDLDLAVFNGQRMHALTHFQKAKDWTVEQSAWGLSLVERPVSKLHTPQDPSWSLVIVLQRPFCIEHMQVPAASSVTARRN
jgi:hypothetical protein